MSENWDAIAVKEMVKRGHCRDCGNPYWFDFPMSWVCSMCKKTHGKDTSEQRKPREGEPLR